MRLIEMLRPRGPRAARTSPDDKRSTGRLRVEETHSGFWTIGVKAEQATMDWARREPEGARVWI